MIIFAVNQHTLSDKTSYRVVIGCGLRPLDRFIVELAKSLEKHIGRPSSICGTHPLPLAPGRLGLLPSQLFHMKSHGVRLALVAPDTSDEVVSKMDLDNNKHY